MSLTKEALLRIEELSASSLKIESTLTKPVALPSGVLIHDLEIYQELRYQFRGRMKTESIKDFIEYCNLQKVGACFINREEMTAETIFDIGDKESPGHCRHTGFIKLRPTADFLAMTLKHDKRLTQQDIAEYLEDWRDQMVLKDIDNKDINVNAAIAAVRKVTIKVSAESEHKVGSFTASTSGMDRLDASSGEENLPAFIKFTCTPFYGLEEYEFNLRISLVLTGGEPVFILRPIKFDVVQEEISDEFRCLITDDLDDKIIPYMGSFDPK